MRVLNCVLGRGGQGWQVLGTRDGKVTFRSDRVCAGQGSAWVCVSVTFVVFPGELRVCP